MPIYPNSNKNSNKRSHKQEIASVSSPTNSIDLNFLYQETSIHIETAEFIDDKLHLYAFCSTNFGLCPYCGYRSEKIHSRYDRTIADLPIINKGVIVHFHARKFFCSNPNCRKKTFAEQPGNEVFRYRRRTRRCEVLVLQHSAVTSSSEAMHLLNNMRISISGRTILRGLHRINVPDKKDVKEIGVDDWAFRKGVTYGSIIINLENSCFLGLLHDREQNSFKKWLDSHQEVCIVSRDRSTEYSAAIASTGRPITEVADRFHLIKNMSDCVTKVISAHYTDYRNAVHPCGVLEEPPVDMLQKVEPHSDTHDNKYADSRDIMFVEVKELQAKGGTINAISRKLGIARQTVRKYMKWSSLPPRRSKVRNDYYLYDDYITKAYLEENKSMNAIFKQIKSMGASFSKTPFETHYKYLVEQRKKANEENAKKKSRKVLDKDMRTSLMPIKAISYIVEKDIREKELKESERELIGLLSGQQWFNQIRDAAKSFYQIIKGTDTTELQRWLETYKNTGIEKLNTFIKGINMDKKAVMNAIAYPISNGIVEGFVNKLKNIKRMLYGRATLKLIERKLYLTGKTFFN